MSLRQPFWLGLRTLALVGLLGLASALPRPANPTTSSPASPPEGPTLAISEVRLVDDELAGLAMSGQVSVTLSPVLISAIERGVPLVFTSDFQVLRERWWWFDREVFVVRRSARLTFHSLTRQFRVAVDGAKPQAFSDLTEALKAGLALKGWRVMPEPIVLTGLTARVRLQLDVGALPKALQVTALTDPQWTLDTGWVRLDRTNSQ